MPPPCRLVQPAQFQPDLLPACRCSSARIRTTMPGLAGPRSTGNQREVAQHRSGSRCFCQSGSSPFAVGKSRSRSASAPLHRASQPAPPRASALLRQLMFILPVTLQIEPAAVVEYQRANSAPTTAQRCRALLHSALGGKGGTVGTGGAQSSPVACTDGPPGDGVAAIQRCRQQQLSDRSSAKPAHQFGKVDIRAAEQACPRKLFKLHHTRQRNTSRMADKVVQCFDQAGIRAFAVDAALSPPATGSTPRRNR